MKNVCWTVFLAGNVKKGPKGYLMEFTAKDGVPCLLSNFQGLHLWLDVEGNPNITLNFNIFFHIRVEISRAVSIPEKGNMTKFNSLADPIK